MAESALAPSPAPAPAPALAPPTRSEASAASGPTVLLNPFRPLKFGESSRVDGDNWVQESLVVRAGRRDTIELFYTSYMPKDNQPRALVFWLHGYNVSCHQKKIIWSAEQLASSGLGFCSQDHSGYGNSSGLRAACSDFNEYVIDARQLLVYYTTKYPDIPYIIFGESMGGLMSILLSIRVDQDGDQLKKRWAGTVMIAPALRGVTEPNCCVIGFLQCIVGCCPLAPLVPPLNLDKLWDPARSPGCKEEQEADMKSGLSWDGNMRLGLGNTMLENSKHVWSMLPSVKWPFFVLHGTNDVVIDINGSERLFKETGTAQNDKQYKTYKDVGHDMLADDPCKNQIFADITAWIEARVQGLGAKPQVGGKGSVTGLVPVGLDVKGIRASVSSGAVEVNGVTVAVSGNGVVVSASTAAAADTGHAADPSGDSIGLDAVDLGVDEAKADN